MIIKASEADYKLQKNFSRAELTQQFENKRGTLAILQFPRYISFLKENNNNTNNWRQERTSLKNSIVFPKQKAWIKNSD